MTDIPHRTTIGFLSANINAGSSRTLWPGVVAAARDLDVNLILFPGGVLGAHDGMEAQRNLLYALISPDYLDGLVSWASTLGSSLPLSAVSEFHQQFAALPLVSLALPMPGFPAVLIDSYSGMRAALAHLVEVHGMRRLAFVRGPENHYYAQQRYRAYLDALVHYGIELDARLVTPPLPWEGGAEAVRILLDERGLVAGTDFEAVVFVSDLLALGALKSFHAHGVAVPGTVALVGVNNSTEGRFASPPLTSVTMPLHDQGYRAAQELVGMLRGTPAPEMSLLPTRLLVRQSCGCPPQAVLEAALNPRRGRAARSACLARLQAQVLHELPVPEWPARLLESFEAGVRGTQPPTFLGLLDECLLQSAELDADLTAWQGVISTLRRLILPGLRAPARLRCEDLCGQARVLIGEIAQRDQSRRLLRAERRAGALRDVGQALISSWDVAGIMDALRDHLPRMGISAGFLAMYANPDAPLAQARLMLAFSEQGRAVLEPGGRSFPTRQLVPQDLLPRRRCDLVVEPLFFHEEPIGFFVLEIGPLDGVVYEVLRTMVSSALKGALLFAEAEQQKQQLAASERMMTELAIRDSLTGLFNRRYMEETLERELQRMARKQLSLGVLMIDIDHFKEFNDRFGHPAGDEMLRQLGLVFGEHIRGSDLAYRFGGEEFVLVLPETSLEVTRLRAEQLREKVRQMNVTYADQTLPPVTLSLGVAAFPVHGMNCAALLKAADVALYCAKAAGRDRVVVAGWNEEKDGLTR